VIHHNKEVAEEENINPEVDMTNQPEEDLTTQPDREQQPLIQTMVKRARGTLL
jgi:hypothetical protein